MNELNRRTFLELCVGGCGSLAFCGCGSGGCKPVRMGVISDTHVTGEKSAERLRRALTHFRDAEVAAVLHCGDVTDLGYRSEYEAFLRVWNEVMRTSVRLIAVLGNRDLSDTKKISPEVVKRDAALLLTSTERGRNAGVHLHEVSGVYVVALDWKHEDELESFVEKHPELHRKDRPLVVLQHRHMAGTVFDSRPGDWMADSGKGARYLRRFPKAISFSGHSHRRCSEPKSVWRGDFTAFAAGSCYVGPEDGGYEVSILDIRSDRVEVSRGDLRDGCEKVKL